MNRKHFIQIIAYSPFCFNIQYLSRLGNPVILNTTPQYKMTGILSNHKINKKRLDEAERIYAFLMRGSEWWGREPWIRDENNKPRVFKGIKKEIDNLLYSPVTKDEVLALCRLQNPHLRYENSSGSSIASLVGLSGGHLGLAGGFTSIFTNLLDSAGYDLSQRKAEYFKRSLCSRATRSFHENKELLKIANEATGIEYDIKEDTNFDGLIPEETENSIKNKILFGKGDKNSVKDSIEEVAENVNQKLKDRSTSDKATFNLQDHISLQIEIESSFLIASNYASLFGEPAVAHKINQFGNIALNIHDTYTRFNQLTNVQSIAKLSNLSLMIVDLFSKPSESPETKLLNEIYEALLKGFEQLNERLDILQDFIGENFKTSFQNQRVMIDLLYEILDTIKRGNIINEFELNKIQEELNKYIFNDKLRRQENLRSKVNIATTNFRFTYGLKSYELSGQHVNELNESLISLVNYLHDDCFKEVFTGVSAEKNIEGILDSLKSTNRLEELLPLLPSILEQKYEIQNNFTSSRLINIKEWKASLDAIFILLTNIGEKDYANMAFKRKFMFEIDRTVLKSELDRILGYGLANKEFINSLDHSVLKKVQEQYISKASTLLEKLGDYLIKEEQSILKNRDLNINKSMPNNSFIPIRISSEGVNEYVQCKEHKTFTQQWQTCLGNKYNRRRQNIWMIDNIDSKSGIPVVNGRLALISKPGFDLIKILSDFGYISIINENYMIKESYSRTASGGWLYVPRNGEAQISFNKGPFKGFILNIRREGSQSNSLFGNIYLANLAKLDKDFTMKGKTPPSDWKARNLQSKSHVEELEIWIENNNPYLILQYNKIREYLDEFYSNAHGNEMSLRRPYIDILYLTLLYANEEHKEILLNTIVPESNSFVAQYSHYIDEFESYALTYNLISNLLSWKKEDQSENIPKLVKLGINEWKDIVSLLQKRKHEADNETLVSNDNETTFIEYLVKHVQSEIENDSKHLIVDNSKESQNDISFIDNVIKTYEFYVLSEL